MTFIQPHERNDSLGRKILRLIKKFFIVMGVAATVTFFMLFITLHKLVNYTPPSLPDSMILAYAFKPDLLEKVTMPSLTQPLLRPPTTFHEVIDDLTQAAKDPRVKGFVARLQGVRMAPAQIQELRNTIAAFRRSGKFASIFTEDFGSTGAGTGEYYLASSFDEIWLQPVGAVSLYGVSAEVPFFKTAMDKIGVTAQFSHKGIYKSSPESLTETEMSVPHREMMTELIQDLAEQVIAGIAEGRKMTADDVQAIMNSAPYSDSEALKIRLIDKIGYYDQMLEEAKTKAGGKDTEVIGLQGYSFTAGTTNLNLGITGFVSKFFHKTDPVYTTRNKAKIALIFGAGEITSYKKGAQVAFGEAGITADKVVAAFDAAEKDNDVVAVVFRVDSPGGAPAAAESIRRAIMKIQRKGKPVIVSMGGYAASGGYWIATSADKIVAQPATITGSIGVFGGKFVLAQLWEKLGVNWQAVSSNDNARMWSPHAAFSEKQKLRFDAMLNSIYEAFIARVMEGRKMTREQVLGVAEGRVWTGRQAKEKGLVDELGGLDRAIDIAKMTVKLPADQDVPVERFPAQKSTLEMFLQLATEGVLFTPDISISVKDILQGLKVEIEDEAQLSRLPQIQLY